jgi:glucokinase
MASRSENNIDIAILDNITVKTKNTKPADKVYLGIDIGGTNTKIGLVNKRGKNAQMISFATDAHLSFSVFVDKLVRKIKDDLLYAHDQGELQGIGIGAPNANHWTGMIENPSNLSWGTVDLVTPLSEIFNVPASMTNDANAAAMGEKYFGAAKKMSDFILLTLGTGLGSGIMINNSIIYGAGGHAGEIGHMVVRPDGRQCGCGRRGCLETYVSAPGIRRTVFELLSEYNEPSILRNISFSALRAEDITDAAQQGDKIALLAFEKTGEILGLKLADVVALMNPEAIILAGGLAQAGELLLKPVQNHLEKNLLSIFRGQTKLIQSVIPEGKLAVMGAGAMVMEKVESES